MSIRPTERLTARIEDPQAMYEHEVGIRINGVGKNGFIEILYADIPGNSWDQNRLNKLTARIQDLMDVRIPLTDPSLIDDPAGPNGADPSRPSFFWDDGDLVARSRLISGVSFDTSSPFSHEHHLTFTLAKVR